MWLWKAPLQDRIHEVLSSSFPAQWSQAFFVLGSCLVLAVAATPQNARRHLLDYGARTSKAQTNNVGAEHGGRDLSQNGGWLTRSVAALTSRGQVPHSWFSSFYLTSLAWSFFWLAQYLSDGKTLHFLAARQMAASPPTPSMNPGQVALLWSMMLLQAGRRTYEHWASFKPSTSKMWFVHWLLGIFFYTTMGLSVWIEGSGMKSQHFTVYGIVDQEDCAEVILQRSLFSDPVASYSPKSLVATVLFLWAWVNQHLCHKHLAGLKKYSLPNEGLFRFLVCPHYTCECLIYLSMAVAGAPEGTLYNTTLMYGLAFVVVNLGVTAGQTRKWYADKFGADSVAKKWKMIPLMY